MNVYDCVCVWGGGDLCVCMYVCGGGGGGVGGWVSVCLCVFVVMLQSVKVTIIWTKNMSHC